MMDKRIDYDRIVWSCGCDNCIHEDDGRWDDFCRICNPDSTPPSEYSPARQTIQEKLQVEGQGSITYEEYLRFTKTGR